MLRPELGGVGWRPLFTPKRTGCYVNGITRATAEVDPHNERWFCHGVGDFGARAWAPTVAFDGQRWR